MTHQIELADAVKMPLGDKSVDLVLGSPPYIDARTYGIGAQRDCQEWIDWMLSVTAEACRVAPLVIWICASGERDHQYQPAPEGLLYQWWKCGGGCRRPAYWHRVGIPGSGGKNWLRADVEYALAFSSAAGPMIYGEPKVNGHPPKWAPGGEMSHRTIDGKRVNLDDGTDEIQIYRPPAIANPGNWITIDTKVGGGLLGHKLAHENEAPYPLDLARWFIRGWCKPSGAVCDPFCGSGTTCHAAEVEGRNSIGFDIRQSQVDLAKRRMADVTAQGVMF